MSKFLGEMNELDCLRALVAQYLPTSSGGNAGSGGTSANPARYTSATTPLKTADGTIPVGALSWSITAVSGTVTALGSALAVGNTVSGGGYGGATLATAISYTISGSALVQYDTVA